MPHFAYVFERFPTFTQTFCVRELLEIERQGLEPVIFSVRDTRDEIPRHFPAELYDRVHFLPPEKELIDFIKAEKDANRLPQQVVLSLRHWGERPDKMRVYEAAYIGAKMRESGVRHSHSHFAGVGARVGWWLKYCYDFTYSFTGHANDIFCTEEQLDLSLDRLMADASLVVTVSDFTADDLRRRFPGAAGKIKRVYNGLDLSRFAVERREIGPPLIFSVGRLIEKKGFDVLIAACALLRHKGVAFQCEIAGDGPLEENLKAQIAESALGGHVRLLGATPQETVVQKLAATAVFALPCQTEADGGMDNLPTVLMEAMAARVPCVSTRLAGVPEMVVAEKTGLLTEPRHVTAFAEALERLLADPALRGRFAEAGYQRCCQLFAQDATAKQLRRHLIARGLVKFSPKLAFSAPSLATAYARQAAWRTARLLRFQSFRHRREADFLRSQP